MLQFQFRDERFQGPRDRQLELAADVQVQNSKTSSGNVSWQRFRHFRIECQLLEAPHFARRVRGRRRPTARLHQGQHGREVDRRDR